MVNKKNQSKLKKFHYDIINDQAWLLTIDKVNAF